MARDKGLEELINDDLSGETGITTKAMFGGWAWLMHGNLLCAARHDGMLARLGKGRDDWALKLAGIEPMMSGDRVMRGWVRIAPSIYGDDVMRRRLLDAAIAFVRSAPAK